jgi:hypothetical protein
MNRRKFRDWTLVCGLLSVFIALTCFAAYNHNGDTDSQYFRAAYPQAVGTKLDSCTTCHGGGSYTSGGKTTTLGSCQWCHYQSNYGSNTTQYATTLNSYGLDYYNHGRGAAAITAIQNLDSDGDSYSNKVEIAALRYPGDANDNPTKVAAPSKVFTLDQIAAMPQHFQFLVMNASKSTDTYSQYGGVVMENFLKPLMLPSATQVTVLSPDGFSALHPFQYDPNPNLYNVYGTYPAANFYYNAQADVALNPSTGWCDYSAPSVAGRNNGDPIVNSNGLRMILAITRDGQYLAPGALDATNKLNGEGPYRVVPPQKIPGPPDQRSTATNATDPATWIWPYVASADHNAGFSSRSVTMIRVEPLPAGTTDINTLEAGWPYIDSAKIVVYGAINPLDNINEKLVKAIASVDSIPQGSFKSPMGKWTLKAQLQSIQSIIAKGDYAWAYNNIQQNVLGKMHTCPNSGYPNDWLRDCDAQTNLYWAVYEIGALLNILT